MICASAWNRSLSSTNQEDGLDRTAVSFAVVKDVDSPHIHACALLKQCSFQKLSAISNILTVLISVLNTVPDVQTEDIQPFDYIICTTKNIPDVPPTLVDVIRPAVTPGSSTIVLLQNGLNIEKPFFEGFPTNTIISGTSFCESHQVGCGAIRQSDTDKVVFGAFNNPQIPIHQQHQAAQDFCSIYSAAGKCNATYDPDVGFIRWRKLLYNACLNPICAITDLDTGRLQLAEQTVQNLVVPTMQEIRAAAKACGGHDLPEDLIPQMISLDRITTYNAPSMQVDLRAGRFSEFENLVGEPMREGLAKGVHMPNITALYHILSAIQWGTKVKRGMLQIPPPQSD